MLPLALLPLLLTAFATWTASVFLFVRLPSLCLGVCLLYTRLSTHFSAVHSVVIVCVRDIRPLFKLLVKFEMY